MSNYLLIAQAESHRLSLLNSTTLDIIRHYDMPGRTAVLGTSSDKQYGFAIHRDDNFVSIIDPSNLTMLRTVGVDQHPTHFHAHDGYSVIFNDGVGSVSIFDEANLPEFTTTVVTQPDHGSALLIGDYLLVGYLRRGCVEVYRRDHTDILQIFDCCPMLHGATQVNDIAIFGCSDGVLLLKPDGDKFSAIKIDNPQETPQRVRVGLFATHPNSPFALGNFGQGLALIDTQAETMHIISLSDYPIKFSFDPTGEAILVLTANGVFQKISLTGDIQHATQVTPPTSIPKGPDGKLRPSFIVGGRSAYIISPDESLLVELSLTTFVPRQRTQLDFSPSAITFLNCPT